MSESGRPVTPVSEPFHGETQDDPSASKLAKRARSVGTRASAGVLPGNTAGMRECGWVLAKRYDVEIRRLKSRNRPVCLFC